MKHLKKFESYVDRKKHWYCTTDGIKVISGVLDMMDIDYELRYDADDDLDGILEILGYKHPDLHIFVIGGANIYRQALPFCEKLYITRVHGAYKCDTFMYNQDFEGFGVQEYIDVDEDLTIQIRGRV